MSEEMGDRLACVSAGGQVAGGRFVIDVHDGGFGVVNAMSSAASAMPTLMPLWRQALGGNRPPRHGQQVAVRGRA